jgi:hypothetical protein
MNEFVILKENAGYRYYIDEYGIKFWLLHNSLHREDGPAIEHEDGCTWYLHGKKHRVDGPAVINVRWKRWFLNGKEYTYENWFQALTPEQQYNYLWNLDE